MSDISSPLNNTRKLYTLRVEISDGSQTVHSKQVNIGFRTIELVQEPLPGNALSFYFKVNGYPLFVKGSNWIPSNILPEQMTNDTIRHLLTSAAAANMNM